MTRSVVRYWEKWGGQEERAMREIVLAFNAFQDRFEVKMESTGDWASSPDLPRFLTAQASGESPDIIGLEDHQIVDLALQGVLKPLGCGGGFRSDFHPGFERLGKADGVTYGAPVSANVITLYVNVGALPDRDRSLPVPFDTASFDLLLKRIEAEGRVGLVPSYPGWWPQMWPYFFGGTWFQGRKFTPATPANIKGYEWAVSLAARASRLGGNPFSLPVNPIGRLDPDPFLSGEVATVVEGDWLVRRLIRHPHLEWVPAPLPSLDGRPQSLIVADVLCIPQGARNLDGAQAFIEFASMRSNLESLAIGQNKISPLQDWSPPFLKRHPNPQIERFRDILSTCDLISDPRVSGWLGYLERIKSAFDAMWSGRQTPAEALSDICPQT